MQCNLIRFKGRLHKSPYLLFIPGTNCELCKDGFYGLATNKQPDDCKTCMCPGGLNMPNQFATKCALDKDKEFTCTDCQTGYTGRRCERCSDGYYGNPMV